jgi:hypothetical protein
LKKLIVAFEELATVDPDELPAGHRFKYERDVRRELPDCLSNCAQGLLNLAERLPSAE